MSKLEQSCLNNRQLRLYIHIPFCVSKCYYCDFYSHVGTDEEQKEYINNLIEEIKEQAASYKDRVVTSIFIGGGTPSLIPIDSMKEMMKTVFAEFSIQENAEISIEMNPKTKTKEKLQAYLDMGINRLSIGMQTTIDEELKALGRCHTYAEFLNTYQTAREVGFQNINIDIMEAIPGQTIESYLKTLERVCKLKPEHISSYSLILEEGTKFYDWYVRDKHSDIDVIKELPSEDVERKMYKQTQAILDKYGYKRYEISNYAREGMECKHNIGYWTGDDYLGFGKVAASLVNHVRWTNGVEEKHELTKAEQMEEFMFLGLRLMKGVSRSEFTFCFGLSMEEIYGDVIESLMNEELLMSLGNDRLALTERGIDVSNFVFGQFLQNVI